MSLQIKLEWSSLPCGACKKRLKLAPGMISHVSFRTFQGKKKKEEILSSTKDMHFYSHLYWHHMLCKALQQKKKWCKSYISHLCTIKHRLPDMPLSCTRLMCHRCDMYYKYAVISVHTSTKLTIRTTCDDKAVNIEN